MIPSENIITGYEQKPTSVVIENWLYNRDKDAQIMASLELRRRLAATYKQPDWMKKDKNGNT